MQATAALPSAPDAVLVEALRARDEDAYVELVRRHTPLMLRVVRGYVGRRDIAEDVVQDTWVAVLRAVDGFQGRSTFKTWLMRILVNNARTRTLQEGRTVCWSSQPQDAGLWDAAVRNAGFAEPAGPERCALGGEVWAAVQEALRELPERQRMVVVLRDVEGWSSDEVRDALRISVGNQRVLLHRGRARLRAALAPFVELDELLEEPELAGAGHGVGA